MSGKMDRLRSFKPICGRKHDFSGNNHGPNKAKQIRINTGCIRRSFIWPRLPLPPHIDILAMAKVSNHLHHSSLQAGRHIQQGRDGSKTRCDGNWKWWNLPCFRTQSMGVSNIFSFFFHVQFLQSHIRDSWDYNVFTLGYVNSPQLIS